MEYLDFLYQQYKIAIETRKLEIELFWKRSLFFAGFIAAAFIAYTHVEPNQKLPLAIIGILVSYCWMLANKGSKYWFESWEVKVNALEECLSHHFFRENDQVVACKLFQLWSEDKGRYWKITEGSAWSVSRLTILISAAIIPLWAYAIVKEITFIKHLALLIDHDIIVYIWLAYLLAIFIYLLGPIIISPHHEPSTQNCCRVKFGAKTRKPNGIVGHNLTYHGNTFYVASKEPIFPKPTRSNSAE